MNNITERLVDFVEKTEYEHFPDTEINAAKSYFIDFVGVSILGYKIGKLGRILTDYLLQIGGIEESTVLGTGRKIPAINSSLANGINGHSMELDDAHREALGHPGVCVIPAALAVGEIMGCNGKKLLTSILIGYEIFIRLGKSVNPSLLSRGFHTTGVCGSLAAASAASKLLCFDKEKISSSLGIAGIQASGLLAVAHSGQMMKPLNAGNAARNGVFAALMSNAGSIGPKKILEGKEGFVQAFSGNCDYSLILDELGENFKIRTTSIKFYPSCRHTHSSIDAALFIKNKYNIDPKEIKEVCITTYPDAIRLTRKEKMPNNESEAKFNLAFLVSLVLIKGKIELDGLTIEDINCKMIQKLFNKVIFKTDPSFFSIEKKRKGSKLSVTLKNDKKYVKIVYLPKGDLENPATIDELYNKYYKCTENIWSTTKQKKVLEMINSLERIDNINLLINEINK